VTFLIPASGPIDKLERPPNYLSLIICNGWLFAVWQIEEVNENGRLGLGLCFCDPGDNRGNFRVCRNRGNIHVAGAGAVLLIPERFCRDSCLGPKRSSSEVRSKKAKSKKDADSLPFSLPITRHFQSAFLAVDNVSDRSLYQRAVTQFFLLVQIKIKAGGAMD
jgi:hypothetical protein